MTGDNLYQSPRSDLENPDVQGDIVEIRRNLIPIWIKVFGWLFIVFGGLVALVGVFAAVTGAESEFSFYGLETSGSIYNPVAFFILVLFIAHGVCAFGLLFGKSWGVKSCLALAYLSMAVCILTMFTGDGIFIRLELLLLIPYTIKLHKILPFWASEKVSAPQEE